MCIVMLACISYAPDFPYTRAGTQQKSQPYITKHYFGLQKPPVNLAKIAMGNGVIPNFYVFAFLPMVCVPPFPSLTRLD